MKRPIIIVDDDEDDLHLFSYSFSACKLDNPILTVKAGEYLFHVLKTLKEPPALIFLDLKLILMDGLEVLKQLRSMEKYRTVPICMLSGNADPEVIAKAYALGANKYLIKPRTFAGTRQMFQEIRDTWLAEVIEV